MTTTPGALNVSGEDFQIGERVEKFWGEAKWHGVVVAAYDTTKGKRRFVVDVEPQGFQMIAVGSQLRRALSPASEEKKFAITPYEQGADIGRKGAQVFKYNLAASVRGDEGSENALKALLTSGHFQHLCAVGHFPPNQTAKTILDEAKIGGRLLGALSGALSGGAEGAGEETQIAELRLKHPSGFCPDCGLAKEDCCRQFAPSVVGTEPGGWHDLTSKVYCAAFLAVETDLDRAQRFFAEVQALRTGKKPMPFGLATPSLEKDRGGDEERGLRSLEEAQKRFTEYFVRNYPGPDTIIFDPRWHAPRIFRAARLILSNKPEGERSGEDTPTSTEIVEDATRRIEAGDVEEVDLSDTPDAETVG